MIAEDAVSIAIIGAGWWASSVHLPALARYPGARVVAICDPNRERANSVASAHSIAFTFADVDELLAAGVTDAVIIATPHVSHYALARACLESGVHVLVEKPMTLTADDAFSMVTMAERRNLHLSVGYTYQYAATAQLVRDAVQSTIGELVQVIVEFTSNAAELYALADIPDDYPPDQPHPSAYSLGNGGGQAHTQLTHAIGMVCWVTGKQIRDVVAFTDERGLEVDVDDVAAFRFVGGGSGVAASTGSVGKGREVRHSVRYIGTERSVDQNLLTAEVRIAGPGGKIEIISPECQGNAYRAERPAQAFVDLVRGRGSNLSPARPAAATVAFVEAMLQSSRSAGSRTAVRQLPV